VEAEEPQTQAVAVELAVLDKVAMLMEVLIMVLGWHQVFLVPA
jgi:hypothetical protein